MKIQIEHYNIKHTIEFSSEDLTTDEVVNALFKIMVSAGWSEKTVAEYFINIGSEILELYNVDLKKE